METMRESAQRALRPSAPPVSEGISMGSGRAGGIFSRQSGTGGPEPLEEAGRGGQQRQQSESAELRAALIGAAEILTRMAGAAGIAAQFLPQQTPGEIGLTALGAAGLIVSEAARIAARRIERRHCHKPYVKRQWHNTFWDYCAVEFAAQARVTAA